MSGKKKDPNAKLRRKLEAAAETERMNSERRKYTVLFFILFFILMAGILDTQALYWGGMLNINPFLFFGLTIVFAIALGIPSYKCYSHYKTLEIELAKRKY